MNKLCTENWMKEIESHVKLLDKDSVEIESNQNKVILHYKERTAPLMYREEIVIYENGIVMFQSGGLTIEEKHFTAQLDEQLLNDIQSLLELKTLQDQESCTKAIKDGTNSMLMFLSNGKMRIVYNSNCNFEEFSSEYRCLLSLLGRIVGFTL